MTTPTSSHKVWTNQGGHVSFDVAPLCWTNPSPGGRCCAAALRKAEERPAVG